MSTMKIRVRDLRVGDHVAMVATGIQMAIHTIAPDPESKGAKFKLEYANIATKLDGWIVLDPDVMIILEEWPFGGRNFHESCCKLFAGAIECDCKASDASDDQWGRQS